jgi:hypothetical protein
MRYSIIALLFYIVGCKQKGLTRVLEILQERQKTV